MEDLLVDIHIAQSMAQESMWDSMDYDYKQTLYFAAALEKHGVTKAEFDSSLTYYYVRADRFSDIFNPPGISKGEVPAAGDKATDNAGRSRAAIGFNHIAVHDDGVLAECGEIGCAAQRTAHQALDFLRATARAFALAFYALARALREQAVFSRDPARAATGKPVRNFREERCVADDAGASHFNENGTIGARDKARGHLEIAKFFRSSISTFVCHIISLRCLPGLIILILSSWSRRR